MFLETGKFLEKKKKKTFWPVSWLEPGGGFVYRNYRECFSIITKEGGFGFLFSGLGKGLPRAVPPAALGLLVYEYCEHYNDPPLGRENEWSKTELTM